MFLWAGEQGGVTGPAPTRPGAPGLAPLPSASRAEPRTQGEVLGLRPGSQVDYGLADARSPKGFKPAPVSMTYRVIQAKSWKDAGSSPFISQRGLRLAGASRAGGRSQRCAGLLSVHLLVAWPGPCLLVCQIMTTRLLPSVEGTRCTILNRARRGGRTWRVPMKGTCQGYGHVLGMAMPGLVPGSLALNPALSATSLRHTHITKWWHSVGMMGVAWGQGRLVWEKGGR